MELSFSHIKKKDWMRFQTITQKYFDELKKDKENFPHILDVKTVPNGSGADEGIDILVTLDFDDTIFKHRVTWVVQCKCYNGDVSPSDLHGVNIPTLVHGHKAHGYLLVCKNGVTAGLTKLFDRLNKECRMEYNYMIWTGDDFKEKIQNLINAETYLKWIFHNN